MSRFVRKDYLVRVGEFSLLGNKEGLRMVSERMCECDTQAVN